MLILECGKPSPKIIQKRFADIIICEGCGRSRPENGNGRAEVHPVT